MNTIQSIRNIFTALVAATAVFAITGNALADDWSTLSEKKQTKLGLYMTAEQAYRQTMDNMDKTLFLDIRTPSELNYLGAATVMDAHVPFVFMDTTGWDDKKHRYLRADNKNFVADVEARLKQKGLTRDDTVILMCRSGKRSASAVNMLAGAGFTKVYSVVDGYEGDKAKEGDNKGKRAVNGWKNSGLPWTYSLDKDLMYITR
ncbi:MAG: rhodanese-like domain-containing protein [Pseudomonadota bacterium]